MRELPLPSTGRMTQDAPMASKGKWGYGYGIGGTAFLVVAVLLLIWIVA